VGVEPTVVPENLRARRQRCTLLPRVYVSASPHRLRIIIRNILVELDVSGPPQRLDIQP
jgi:hypothetical protein